MNSYYDYGFYGSGAEEYVADFMGTTLITIAAFCLLIALVFFVFYAIGLYAVAKRRGIDHAWMAWVPVLNNWTLGCVSDQYQYLVKGQNKKRRTVLLVLGIISAVFGALFLGSYIMVFVNMFQTILSGVGEEVMAQQMMYRMFGPMMVMVFSMLPYLGVSIALLVFRYIALYDLFKSCAPKESVVFLVLSIIFNVTEPFFVFACRNKDEGMPPRRISPEI